jgi:hypothetical protein
MKQVTLPALSMGACDPMIGAGYTLATTGNCMRVNDAVTHTRGITRNIDNDK